jgi:hypothetical protein
MEHRSSAATDALMSPRSVAGVYAGTVLATAGIGAPPEAVYRGLTTAGLGRWWGSDEPYWSSRPSELNLSGPCARSGRSSAPRWRCRITP